METSKVRRIHAREHGELPCRWHRQIAFVTEIRRVVGAGPHYFFKDLTHHDFPIQRRQWFAAGT
tara:strand:+ start:58 stop:249 length:192 start_codon:yes stop_codon:yes gene_type:complete